MPYVNPIPYIEAGKEFELRVKVTFDEVVEVGEARKRAAEFIKNMPIEELASALSCLGIKAVYPKKGE